MKPRLQALLLFLMAIAHTAVADEIMQPRTAIQNAPDACVCTMAKFAQRAENVKLAL